MISNINLCCPFDHFIDVVARAPLFARSDVVFLNKVHMLPCRHTRQSKPVFGGNFKILLSLHNANVGLFNSNSTKNCTRSVFQTHIFCVGKCATSF